MVIWITGFSSSGKTTVARKLKAKLMASTRSPIVHMDGDDLRQALGENFGYSREQRVELAFSYFRLCNIMAEQGVVVIISAVAMYREVFEWARRHIDDMHIVYLRVPESELRARDKGKKNVYDKIENLSELYDTPHNADLVCDNYGDRSPDQTVADIVNHCTETRGGPSADHGRQDHWATFYGQRTSVPGPSDFARFAASRIAPDSSVIDLGCGNGRDTFYLSKSGQRVIGVDVAPAAIQSCRDADDTNGILWIVGPLSVLRDEYSETIDVIYCRFVLHAMSSVEETDMIAAALDLLKTGGQLFIECRSINDAQARRGEFVSPTERIDGHYRRFIVPDILQTRIETAGFRVTHFQESTGLAMAENEDPAIIRLIAEKA